MKTPKISYEDKIVLLSDGQKGRVIEEFSKGRRHPSNINGEKFQIYEEGNPNDERLTVLLAKENLYDLIKLNRRSGTRIETTKSLVTLLNQEQEVNQILDGELENIIQKPIPSAPFADANSYGGLDIKPDVAKIMQIIFQFVANKQYPEFPTLLQMRKDIKNEFIQEIESYLGVQITKENRHKRNRLLLPIKSTIMNFYNEAIYQDTPASKRKARDGQVFAYNYKENIDNFTNELLSLLDYQYNEHRKKYQKTSDAERIQLMGESLLQPKYKEKKNSERDLGLTFE